jgi:hypothetical protein
MVGTPWNDVDRSIFCQENLRAGCRLPQVPFSGSCEVALKPRAGAIAALQSLQASQSATNGFTTVVER